MPPRCKPKPLHVIGLSNVASLTDRLCMDIELKYGSWNSPASQKALSNVKTYLLSIQSLFNRLCKEVLDSCSIKHGLLPNQTLGRVLSEKYLILELLLGDKITTLNLSSIPKLYSSYGCFSDSVFWESQLVKLNNVVELDIMKVRLTDKSFQAIGDVCTNLKNIGITSDLHYASMESLLHVLKCRELRDVRIGFCNWEEESICEYIRTFVTGLPKLEYFHDWLELNIEEVTSIVRPVMSMRRVKVKSLNSVELAAIIRLCPNLEDISLGVKNDELYISFCNAKHLRVLNVLAGCPWQLKNIALKGLAFGPEMIHMITSKGRNIKILNLTGFEGKIITVNDIYVVGMSCPEIEELRIDEHYTDFISRIMFIHTHRPEHLEKQTFVTTPPMFTYLKVLLLHSNIVWDPRILPLLLIHANNLTSLSLKDVFKPPITSLNMVVELIDENRLRELQSVSLYAECDNEDSAMTLLSIASIGRLLSCCPKLTALDIVCPMDGRTIEYLRILQRDLPRENFDISIKFNPSPVYE